MIKKILIGIIKIKNKKIKLINKKLKYILKIIQIMEATPEFASFKKVIIFGSKGSGKTSLSKRIERGSFTNETPTDNGKIKLI